MNALRGDSELWSRLIEVEAREAPRGDIQAAQSRHADVEEGDVRLLFGQRFQRTGTVLAGGNDLQLRPRLCELVEQAWTYFRDVQTKNQKYEPLLRQEAVAEDLGRWLGLLSLYDVVFVLLSVAVFDFLLED